MTGVIKRSVAFGANTVSRLPLPLLLRRMQGDPRNVLHVLTYHRVDWPDARPELLPATLSATPKSFAAQMRRIRQEFCPVNLAQVSEAVQHGSPLPPRAVLITFDDGYRDFRQHAWPVLQELKIPVVVFVPTKAIDDPRRPFWWDRLHWSITQAPRGAQVQIAIGIVSPGAVHERPRLVARLIKKLAAVPHAQALLEVDRVADAFPGLPNREAVMNWNDLRTLANEGVELAPHSRSHPLLDRISSESARVEIAGSRADLQQQIGRCPNAFAYPGGAHNNSTRAILAEEGFKLGFTTRRGANRLAHCDPLQLRRINVGLRTTADMLSLQLSLPPRLFNACCG